MDWTFSFAGTDDVDLLAGWNQRLIQDEQHANRMTEKELKERMRRWLQGAYQAVIFKDAGVPVAYALFQELPDRIHLRQFYVCRDRRRTGVGRRAMTVLMEEIWPVDKRLTVEVLTANPVATAFWRAVGYKDYSLLLEIRP